MELITLNPEEARHAILWLSPEGKIFSLSLTSEEIATSLFKQLSNTSRTADLDFLNRIAELICREFSVIPNSAKNYLLNHGWIHYCQIRGSWIWYGRKLTICQSTIARQIDNNISLQLLIDKLRWNFLELHFCSSLFYKRF